MPENKDFVVKDRRIFSEEGRDTKETVEEKAPPEAPPERASQKTPSAAEADEAAGAARTEAAGLPEINFSTFILSLNASALMHLGMIDDPMTGKPNKNLPLGKQTIDILGMLEEKTKGNLTQDEESMLKSILYDLRINFVRQSGSS